MPYKRQGRTVYVQRGGKWRLLKTHETAEKAKRHLAALNINVSKRHKGKGKK